MVLSSFCRRGTINRKTRFLFLFFSLGESLYTQRNTCRAVTVDKRDDAAATVLRLGESETLLTLRRRRSPAVRTTENDDNIRRDAHERNNNKKTDVIEKNK